MINSNRGTKQSAFSGEIFFLAEWIKAAGKALCLNEDF